MVSHFPVGRAVDTHLVHRRRMVKGKRRTTRTNKDENMVLNHQDGPKGPKDSRMDLPDINGKVKQSRLLNGKLEASPVRKKEMKITNYFSPARSPPAADDAEPAVEKALGVACDDAEIKSAQLSRPCSQTSRKIALLNGDVGTQGQRTMCTRSQALKEVQLQPATIPGSATQPSAATSPNPATPVTPVTKLESEELSGVHSGPTPHKIQALDEERLRLDSPLSPSKALAKLKLTLTPKKLEFNRKTSKARKKLPTHNVSRVNNFAKTGKATKPNGDNKSSRLANGESKRVLGNTQMTHFFPIRRSERKPKTTLLQEKQKEIEHKILTGKEEGLRVHSFGCKGRGVVTTRQFAKGEFVVEYIGDLIDTKEAKERELKYAQDSSKGCYMYYFTYQNVQYCIDATEETGFLGRLVNHSRVGNLATKTVEVQGRPHLILIAKRDLEAGIEVLYDYGDRSKESLVHHPWLAT